ncbi:hypothetical protein L1887_14208 [Cichorium endivia]|nr:hypothetical protein L1887_14208 [Cichorium endivia]
MWVSMIAAVGSIRAEAKPIPESPAFASMKIVVDRMRVEWGDKANKQWVLDWQAPKDSCSVYKVCGSFGMCNIQANDRPSCSCMRGFQPTLPKDYTAGCKRTTEICHNTKETFVNLTMISIDDTDVTFLQLNNESACINKCLENCQCQAYSYTSLTEGQVVDQGRNYTQGCWFWYSVPSNLKAEGRHNISIRVSEELRGPHVNARSKFLKRILPLVAVISALVLLSLGVLTYIYYKRLVNRIAENTQQSIELQSSNTRRVIELLDPDHSIEDDTEGVDVPYFELDTLIAATQDFSEKNKLGQGGFGPVYKAWSLWTEQKPQELMDQTLMESCNPDEVLKCIIIGLLCVQAQPDDRPSMENVIVMLGGEIYTLPTPKEPTVISGRDHATPSSSGLAKPDTQTKNMLEITELDGR